MDPHQIQNNLGMNGMQNYQFLMQQQQSQPQQQQPQATNQAQFSTFQQLYQNPQMNMFSDPALFLQQNQHQQQNLLFQMQAQSQPQVYQQQLYQQHLLQQQQYLQPNIQQALQQQQQQQLQHVQEQTEAELRQQRLIEQQNRQMEQIRKEQEAQALAQRRKQEIEEAKRAEQMRELQRIEEEKKRRIAEEEERKRKEGEKRQEELRRIAAEEEERKRVAEEAVGEIIKRSDVIPKPFTLVACAPLTKLTSVLPFPSEAPASSISSSVLAPDAVASCLSAFDPETIGIISEALGMVDISHVMVRGAELSEEVSEQHTEHPALIAKLLEMNPSILSVDDEISTLLSAFDGTDMDTSGGTEAGPSTSSNHQPVAPPMNPEALRKMISLGKQPKGKGGGTGGGRKKDMVEELFDSLTDYFDPSDGRRKRHRVKTYEEEQLETRELEMVAASEVKQAERAKEREKENELMVNDIDQLEEGKFFEKKRQKKKEREPERPPTPTEVLRQREEEWREREKKRNEKRRRRVDEKDDWSNDVRAENESLARCTQLIDGVVDNIDIDANEIEEDSEMPQELLIDRAVMDQLRAEVQKLKMYKKMHEVPTDRVMKLLTILERNMRDVIATEERAPIVPVTDEECAEDDNELFREMIDERLQRGADAACTAMIAITANKMPKTVFLEDTMERAVQVCKQYLTTIIFPASDVLYQGVNRSKRIAEDVPKKKRKLGGANRTPIVQILYTRMLDLLGCFGELVRYHTLPDTFYHQLNTTALSCFFVSNIAELQLKAMTVLANIFARVDEHIRSPLISDLLNSLHRLPPKTASNGYLLSNGQAISYSTCLFMLLIQASIKIPHRKRRRDDEEDDDDVVRDFSKEDSVVRDSIGEAKTLCNKFIVGFLSKVVAKGEEEYRNLFGNVFLHDLLSAFMVPEWPVAEIILSAVGGYICTLYRSKVDVSVRSLIMEYLGHICARLSKEKKEAGRDAEMRLGMIVKTLLYCEREDERTAIDEIDVSHMSSNELLRKAEKGLIDYLVVSNSSSEFSIEYAVKYYVGDWYRMTMEDIEGCRERHKGAKDEADSDRDRRKADRKLEKVEEKGRKQKEFLLELSDKKMIRKRADQVARSGSIMLNADAQWLIKHLAMCRDFCNSFDPFLKQILVGVTSEGAVGLRTRAMKSLTQIIEVDYNVLGLADVRRSVHARMTDPNAQVREATIELLGKFIVARPDLIQDYYQILIERIKDSGTSVRKRIIRIMREYCEKNPEYENASEMLSRIVRRVNDEEGVRKLVMDTMSAIWLQPVKYKDMLYKKVEVLIEVITILMRESGGLDSLEAVFAALLKGETAEKGFVAATFQIVDTLFDNVIQLDMIVDSDDTLTAAEKAKLRQDKMLACLAGLSIFSKVRPMLLLKHIEALQPYLSMTAKTSVEQSVLNQVINMLERVIPLIDHPSAEFITRVDKNLGELVKMSGMTITASAISCAAALHQKAPKLRPSITGLFVQYLKGLLTWRKKLDVPGTEIVPTIMPVIQRSVFALGLMARHYDWDSILTEEEVRALPLLTTQSLAEKMDEEIEKLGMEPEGPRAVRDNVYLLLHYFSRHDEPHLRHKALTALGHLSAEYPEYLQKHEVLTVFHYAMTSRDRHSMQLKIQALKNLEMFLLNEEKKAIKTNSEWNANKDHQELKEMELAGSGLGSTVIQRYWSMVLESYFHPMLDVRMAAMQVIWQTLSQGLVTPGNSIHVLIAMSTDPIVTIRNKVETLVKDIDTKYHGMIQSKAVQGVRSSFRLQKTIQEDPSTFVRGIRAVDQSAMAMSTGKSVPMLHGAPRNANDGQALLSGLYQSLRGNKQQRRALVNSVLRLFTEDTRERLSIDEWIFIADNLAMFPYQVMDEPLYVCKSVESVLTIHGHSTLTQFMAELEPVQMTMEGGGGETNDDDVVFEPERLLARFPADTLRLYEIMDYSQAYFTLLYLKNFLMKFYAITDARVQEYSTSDTSKGHDKGLARKSVQMFQPHSGMQQLRPEVRAMRGTVEGNRQLAQHIAQFRRLLLAIDNKDDDEEDGEEDEKADTSNTEYNEEDGGADE
ncbi:hypothetical protein PFISCL1PPCAC_8219 [Pristionchus fissidentatus]|uniref:Nipped-B protein n=1 Tax=Pristionchus fissidentatus TaxID=1538716 RepID=A0AAV5VDV4_9BILA|nr:hypothetical protein PFISCL1PPCAC_8219 [Pristionchus fissidentatus]